MKKSKKIFVILLSALLTAGCFTGCKGGSEGRDTAGENHLTIMDSEWYGIDTFQLDSSSGAQSLVSSTLFEYDPETQTVVDNVCTDWAVSEDGKTVTFNVPEGLVYSTGETVEPEDVKASLEHGLKISPYRDGYSNIESIEVSDRQITLNLSHFSSDMEYYFTADFICLIDKDELDSLSADELMWKSHPYGPYALAEDNGYVSGSEVNLVRNDEYKCFNPLVENQGAWNFETITCRFNVEEFTETEEVKNGNAGLLLSCTSDQMLELQEAENIELVDTSYPTVNYIEINTDNSIFADKAVREAFCLAIDREGLAEAAEGTATPAYSLIIDTMQSFSQKAKEYFQENWSYDPDRAKKLLKKAGWVDNDGDGIREKDGKKLTFTFLAFNTSTVIPETMTEQMKDVGFEMKMETLDWNYIHERVADDDYDVGISGLGWAEPILILNICYYDLNAPGNDDEYRALVEACAGEVDPQKRVDRIFEVQQYMFENLNIIPLYYDNTYTAVHHDITGLIVQSDGTTLMNDMAYKA